MDDNTEPTKQSKIKKAVALAYEQGRDKAPHVIATGRGLIAEQIIKIARSNGIYVEEDESLAETLGQIEINSIIPLEAYEAVANILSYLYKRKKGNATRF